MLQRNTLILLGVFAVLLFGAILLQQNRGEEPATNDLPTSPPLDYLFDFTGDSVVGVRVEGPEGRVAAFQQGPDGLWLLVEPPASPEETDQVSISSATGQLATVRILSQLETLPGLDVLGLADPQYAIELTLASGNTLDIQVGNPSPTGNGLYVRVNGHSPVLVDRFVLEQFTRFVDFPPLVPTPIVTSTSLITPTLETDLTPSP